MREAVTLLHAELERYEIPLLPDEAPREHDRVRVLKPLKAFDLEAGATGKVIVDYAASTDGGLVGEYEVQFADAGAGDGVLVNVSGDDVAIVHRPGYGGSSR
jgi:hypothetical protein